MIDNLPPTLTRVDPATQRSAEYIRADVAAAQLAGAEDMATQAIQAAITAKAQLDAERKRIVDAVDAIVGMNPSFDVHLSAQAIKAAVWNSDDDPQEILKRELRRMPK